MNTWQSRVNGVDTRAFDTWPARCHPISQIPAMRYIKEDYRLKVSIIHKIGLQTASFLFMPNKNQ